MKILVLQGGSSSERQVSLRSANSVIEALKKNGHIVSKYDPANGFEGLVRYVGKVNCVFPILHGRGGEDGEIQAELEKLGFKYLGADSKVSRLCYDKVKFKEELNKLSILTPKGEIVTRKTVNNSELIKYPYVLKPVDGGSSVDTFIIRDPVSKSYDTSVFNRYSSMLLEELIEGTEITIPVLGSKALPVVEIIPPKGAEFDYENKYNGATDELCPSKSINDKMQAKAQHLAKLIHTKLGVRHLSRTDIIIDNNSKLWVLELNTIPGLTNQSLFPKAAKAAGISFEELVQKFIELTLSG